MHVFHNSVNHVICCRLIQEEKETAELRAEELESRVAVNPGSGNWRPEQMYERNSPPLSGRSTPSPRPSLQSRDYAHKYHTLNSSVSQLLESLERRILKILSSVYFLLIFSISCQV